LKGVECFENSLPRETIKRPEQESVRPTLAGVVPHAFESGAVGLRAWRFAKAVSDQIPELLFFRNVFRELKAINDNPIIINNQEPGSGVGLTRSIEALLITT